MSKSKYNWKVGDKVMIKRKATDEDYRWTIYTNGYHYEVGVSDEVVKVLDSGKAIDLRNLGAIIPRHLLVRVK